MVRLGNVLVDPSQGWVLHPRKLVAYFMCLRMSETEIGRAEPLQRSVKHDGNVHRGTVLPGGRNGTYLFSPRALSPSASRRHHTMRARGARLTGVSSAETSFG